MHQRNIRILSGVVWTAALTVAAVLASQSCGSGGSDRQETGGTSGGNPSRQGDEGSDSDSESEATPTPSASSDPSGFVISPDGTYRIFKYEATLVGTSAQPLSGVDPEVNIDFAGAKAACEASGYRLCTLAEWRAACRGVSDFKYAVSSSSEDILGVCDVNRMAADAMPSQTGQYADCRTAGSELQNMIGNVSEWVVDGTKAVAAGAAYNRTLDDSSCDAKMTTGGDDMPSDTQALTLGFRCCDDLSVEE